MIEGKKPNATTSRYRGIYYRKDLDRWYATMEINKKRTHLGTFPDEFTALLVKDAAIRRFGLQEKYRPYFADHEIGPEIYQMLEDRLNRKQGQPISKTKRKHTKKRAKTSGLRKKMLEIQRLAENEIN